MSVRSTARALAALSLAIVTAAVPVRAAHAQSAPVRLNMDNVTQLYTAMKNLALVAIQHPELGDSLSVDADATEAQAAAQLASKPPVVAALHSAGFTPLEYVRTSMTLLGTEMAYGFAKSMKGYKIPSSVDPANVAFVRDHEAQLTALNQKMQAEIQKLVPAGTKDDSGA